MQDKQPEHSIPDTKNICKQLDIIIVIQDIQTTLLNIGHKYGTITDTVDIIWIHIKGKHILKIPHIQDQQK
jgi:hypothetical protein